MLNKILLILVAFFGIVATLLIFWVYLQGQRIDSLKTAKNTLQANNNLLLTRLEREHNDALEISRKNRELENLAKRAVGFDWNTDISNDELVLWLHENAVRVQGSRTRAD